MNRLWCLLLSLALTSCSDGKAPEDESTDAVECTRRLMWADADSDGYGDPAGQVLSCEPFSGYVDNDDDCDDTQGDRFPGNAERCDGVDQNCSGVADDGLVFEDYWPDLDDDGHGDATGEPTSTCDGPPDSFVEVADDCDDKDEGRFPGNPELCDAVDQDCDEVADDGLVFTDYWRDLDGDGHGDETIAPTSACDGPPVHFVAIGDDCDDGNDGRYPGSPEVCDTADQDCDGVADNGLLQSYWPDFDGDGYGDEHAAYVSTCDGPPDSWVAVEDDCDDGNASVHPGADISSCDFVDTNCDGMIEEYRVGDDYVTVQNAIDAAPSGSTVCVPAGTWGRAAISYKTLSVRGMPGAILDGGGVGPVVSVAIADGSEVSGFTITGGGADFGAGLYASTSDDIWLHDLDVVGNTCTAQVCFGVGMFVTFGNGISITDVLVRENVCANEAFGDDGQGWGCAISLSGTSTVERLTVEANEGQTIVYISGADAVMSDILVNYNVGDSILSTYYNDAFDITRLRMIGNVGNSGAFLSSESWATVTGRNILIADNVFEDEALTLNSRGGDVSVEYVTLADNTISSLLSLNSSVIEVYGVVDMSNSILANNDADFDVIGHLYPVLLNSIWTDFWDTGAIGGYANDLGILGNIAVDPLLQADWRLSPFSPAIDAGEPFSYDADGSPADLGAYGGPEGVW